MPSFIGGVQEGSIVKTDGAANARHIPDWATFPIGKICFLARPSGPEFPERKI